MSSLRTTQENRRHERWHSVLTNRLDGSVSRLHGHRNVPGELPGWIRGNSSGAQAQQQLFQLCRLDHAQLHVRGRLFVPVDLSAPPVANELAQYRLDVRAKEPGAGRRVARDVR